MQIRPKNAERAFRCRARASFGYSLLSSRPAVQLSSYPTVQLPGCSAVRLSDSPASLQPGCRRANPSGAPSLRLFPADRQSRYFLPIPTFTMLRIAVAIPAAATTAPRIIVPTLSPCFISLPPFQLRLRCTSISVREPLNIYILPNTENLFNRCKHPSREYPRVVLI